MGSTIRDLGNTIKEAKKSKKAGELQFSKINADDIQDEDLEEEGSYLDSQRPVSDIMLGGADDNMSQIQHQMSACLENADEEDQQNTLREDGVILNNDEGEDDVIDIDNPDDLAARGLRRIQIDGEEEEFLMDLEGNIYDL